MLRCRDDNMCIHPIDICDGVIHCLLSRDDELLCHTQTCPSLCVCHGNVVKCTGNVLRPYSISTYTKALVYSGVVLKKQHTFGKYVLSLISIDDSKFPSNMVPRAMFANMHLLQTLILRNNRIRSIEQHSFGGLQNLLSIDIRGNSIYIIFEFTFYGLKSIQHLDISNLGIEYLNGECFKEVIRLVKLNISSNSLSTLTSSIFRGLTQLQTLDLRGNNFHIIEFETFTCINSNLSIYVSKQVYCCYVSRTQSCNSSGPSLGSSCAPLFKGNSRKILFSILAGIACIINMIHVVYLSNSNNKKLNSQHLLMQTLACCKLLLAIYAIFYNINAIVLPRNFIYIEIDWPASTNCLALNLLSSTGYLLSKIAILLIVQNQLMVTKYIFKKQPLQRKQVIMCLSFGFVVNFIFHVVEYQYNTPHSISCFIFSIKHNIESLQLAHIMTILIAALLFQVVNVYSYNEIHHSISETVANVNDNSTVHKNRIRRFLIRTAILVTIELCIWLLAVVLVLYNLIVPQSTPKSRETNVVMLFIIVATYSQISVDLLPPLLRWFRRKTQI